MSKAQWRHSELLWLLRVHTTIRRSILAAQHWRSALIPPNPCDRLQVFPQSHIGGVTTFLSLSLTRTALLAIASVHLFVHSLSNPLNSCTTTQHAGCPKSAAPLALTTQPQHAFPSPRLDMQLARPRPSPLLPPRSASFNLYEPTIRLTELRARLLSSLARIAPVDGSENPGPELNSHSKR
jgi:hypothetical protein